MKFQRNFSNEDEVYSYMPGAPMDLPCPPSVISESSAPELMKVSWVTMYHWLSKTNNGEKMGKAIIYNEKKFNFFL